MGVFSFGSCEPLTWEDFAEMSTSVLADGGVFLSNECYWPAFNRQRMLDFTFSYL